MVTHRIRLAEEPINGADEARMRMIVRQCVP